ncbi:MAG: glycoside hydrolase family 16 protein [Chitinophagaceae bacterium]
MSKLLSLLCLFTIIFSVSVAQKKEKNAYKLVWFDEFNNTGSPDTTKWEFEEGYKRNNEAQWYQKDNAFCKDGYLIIQARKETKPNPNYVEGSNNWKTKWPKVKYTSASLVMKKIHAFQYGKLEVKAKIEAQDGLWPAIWTLGVSGKWPANGEVDIMEYYQNQILANYAYAGKNGYQAIWDAVKKPIDSLGGKKWADSFHVWTYLWDENKMQIFVDDTLLNEIDLNTTINKSDGLNPMRQPHYLLLNLALGGDKGGSLANTIFPSNYLVDYVRLYQKK